MPGKQKPGKRHVLRWLRLALLLSLLAMAVLAYRNPENLGDAAHFLPRLLGVHLEREAREQDDLSSWINAAIATLEALDGVPVERRITAVRRLAQEGLARRKSWVRSGLSVHYGQIGAEVRIANHDNSDLHVAVPRLLRALHHQDEILRLEAAHALSQIQLTAHHARYVSVIAGVLANEHSVYVKTYLARAIGDIGPGAHEAAEQLTALLIEDEPRLLASAALAIANIGPGAYSQVLEARLVGLLAHPHETVRDSAAQALGRIGAFSPEAERALRAALADQDPLVCVAAALALADLGITEQSVLIALARGYELAPRSTTHVGDLARIITIRERATGVFTGLGRAPEELLDTLSAVVRQSRDLVAREDAIALLAGDGFSAKRAQALIELLQDRETGVYHAVVDGLVGMGPEVVVLVEPLLDDEQPRLRELASEVLAKIDTAQVQDGDANELLRRALTTASDPNAKAKACRQLGEARAIVALGELATYLDHPDRTLKRCALWAVLRIDPAHVTAKPQIKALIRQSDELGLRVIEDLAPETLAYAPTLIEAWSLADNAWSKGLVAATMARLGHRELLDFLLARRDEPVMNGPLLDVVTGQLIEDLRHYRFQPQGHTLQARRTALQSLEAFGLLTGEQYQAFAAEVENPDLGDWLGEIWRERRAARPQPPSRRDRLESLYGELSAPRNQEVADLTAMLLEPEPSVREGAIAGLARIAAHAVEVPGYLHLALRDPDQAVRRRALQALHESGDHSPEAIAAYRSVLFETEQSDALNQAAARALGAIGAAALPALIDAAGHETIAVRRAAAFGLLTLGADAEPARDVLERLAADPHRGVNSYARQALAALEAQP